MSQMYSFLSFQVECDSKVLNIFHFCNLPITPIMEIQTEVSKPISIKCLAFVALLLNVILKIDRIQAFFSWCTYIYAFIFVFWLRRNIFINYSDCKEQEWVFINPLMWIIFNFYNLFPKEYAIEHFLYIEKRKEVDSALVIYCIMI